ncbi:MAG: hypothetical protein WBP38_00015 [Hyphomicrobium sp.]|nr:hypothetical protein [Hyphomicrobium sp.]
MSDFRQNCATRIELNKTRWNAERLWRRLQASTRAKSPKMGPVRKSLAKINVKLGGASKRLGNKFLAGMDRVSVLRPDFLLRFVPERDRLACFRSIQAGLAPTCMKGKVDGKCVTARKPAMSVIR